MSRRVVEHLLSSGRISRSQLDEAVRMKGFFGGLVESHLLRLGHIDEPVLADALSEVSGHPYASAEQLRRIPPEATARIPRAVLERHRMCPFALNARCLSVAMLDPRDRTGIARIQSATDYTVEPWITSEFRLYQALERHFRIRFPGVKAVAPAPNAAPQPTPGGERSAPRPPPPEPRVPTEEAGAPGDLPVPPRADPGDAEPLPPVPSSGQVPREAAGVEVPELDAPRPADLPDRPVGLTPNLDLHGVREGGASETDLASHDRGIPWERDEPSSVEETIASLDAALCDAATRDAIANRALEVGERFAARGALFAIGREGIRGVIGRGRGLETASLAKLVLEADSGTIFDAALQSRDFYYGVVPPTPPNRDLYDSMGGRLPEHALLLPVKVRDKVVAILYFDNDTEPMVEPDIALMSRVAAKAGLAFEILVLKSKLRAV